MPRLPVLAVTAALVFASTARDASAQDATEYDISTGRALTVTIGTLGAAYLFTFLPVDTSDRWNTELLGPLDESVHDNFSPTSGLVSDVTMYTAIIAPVFIAFRDGFDDRAARRLLVYGEVIGINALANATTKFLVKRPRPYTYNTDPRVQAFAASAGKKSHTSFYSGHSSTSFAAAVAGATIYALSSDNRRLKASAWGIQLALASTTANLRVRAGKHFYSDVVIGALVGSAIGYAIPMLHSSGDGLYSPSAVEIGAMAGGVVAGTFIANVLPFSDEPGGRARLLPSLASTRLIPTVIENGAGLALTGRL